MTRERGCAWYQSMGLFILCIAADLKKNFKGPRPFKQQKTFLSAKQLFMCSDWIMWLPASKIRYRSVFLRYRLDSGRCSPAILLLNKLDLHILRV
jgi:hypothetical protein